MTGDSHSNDDADFLDEDFVVEDLVGKNDDLEDLFDEPAPVEQDSAAEDADAASDAEPDEDDMLFSDHTQGLEASEEFQKPTFDEDGDSQWDGDKLDLESVGVPDTTLEGEEEAADPQIDEAKETFAQELDSLLHEEEDFALDSEADLEVVGAADEGDDGISEFEQSGPFVLDDGDGLWEDELSEQPAEVAGNDEVVELAGDEQEAFDDVVEPAAIEAANIEASSIDAGSVDGGVDAGSEDVVELDASDDAAFADEEEVVDEFDVEPAAEQEVAETVLESSSDSSNQAPTYEELMRQQMAAGAGEGFEEVELGRNEDDMHEEVTLVSADAGDLSGGETMVSDGPMSFGDQETPAGEFEEQGLEEMSLRADAVDGEGAGEAGWEPLPATSMDELSEVDEVQRTDDDEPEYDVSGYEEDEESYDEEGYEDEEGHDGEFAGVGAEADLDDVEGHDIYAEEGKSRRGVVLGGPGSRRSVASLLVSIAASLLILVGAAAVIVRPEWFGLSVEPERVAKVDVARPKIELAIAEPKVASKDEVLATNNPEGANNPETTNPEAGSPETGSPETGSPETGNPEVANPETGNPTTANPVAANPETGNPETSNPETTSPDTGNPETGNPETGNPETGNPATGNPETGAPAVAESNNGGEAVDPPTEVGSTSQPAVVADQGTPETGSQETEVVEAPEQPANGANSWPVAQAEQGQAATAKDPGLTRFGDDLMVGAAAQGVGGAKAINGVMPGSRAFAQLHNGNYFIGKVKQVASETITLRVETGEVTLDTAEIAQLTRLGTNDYDELQKATKGFVRLTNNNRLVGGILSRIADDHIVLEFRSNRVMLPKSVVGEIVSGKEDNGKVRLGTTSEEDNWVRSLAERQLGTGQGAPVKPTGTETSATPGGGQR